MQPATESKVQDDQLFRCKGCRQVLFKTFIHSEPDCSSYFIEQPSWLDINEVDNEIKFKCCKCEAKIGEVIFSGKKCSCGKWVTPAFQVHKNKVDCIKKNL